ncbi:basic proline-rich protein-like [Mus caroli]|uniref:Basic proline-rich protein-like n=1 Tax=Mus caroli TaxID=10089 RepID=A0A6P7RXF2_MUSCR|nr:basic proline-rich protein-like [Mus caroli]
MALASCMCKIRKELQASPPLFLTFVSAEVGSSRRLRDRVVRSGLGSRRDSTAARPRSRPPPLPEPAGSPEGARGAEPPAASHTPAGSRPPASTPALRFPPDPFSNMSPNLPRTVSAVRQRRMDSSHRPGRPPAVRHPPGKSHPAGAGAAGSTASGNGCHFPSSLRNSRTWGSLSASSSLMYVLWGSR